MPFLIRNYSERTVNSYRVAGIPELPDIAQIFSQVHGVWEVSAVVKLF